MNLEYEVSCVEIKRTFWDYGMDKYASPDGFTFEFVRKFWYLIVMDVIVVVKEFFSSGLFPKMCNSSFIPLIPKV